MTDKVECLSEPTADLPPETEIERLERLLASAATDADRTRIFDQLMVLRAGGKCGNCGIEDHLKVELVVPLDLGGKLVVTNATVLCRACSMTAKLSHSGKVTEGKTLVNVWMDREIFASLKGRMNPTGLMVYQSVAEFIRFLMREYTKSPSSYDDLSTYQSPNRDVRLSFWCPPSDYAAFKDTAQANGMTVTDAITALVLFHNLNIRSN